MVTTGPRVGVAVKNEANKRQSDMRIKKEKETQHARFRRCRNSSGAAINPDTKRNTATWQTSRAEIQRWHNFTGFQLERSSKM